MLQKLRDQTQSLGFKVLAGILVFVLAVFGFGAFNLFMGGDQEVASVNGKEITQGALVEAMERERRRIAAQLGDKFDASQIDPALLQASVLEQLIMRALLWSAVEDLGLGSSQQRIERSIFDNPQFQIDGEYDPDLYRRVVSSMLYSPQQYLDEAGMFLALQQLQGAISGTSAVTEWELRASARLVNQRRDLAYLIFQPTEFADQVDVGDDEVALRYRENALDYQTEETVDVAYVELTADALADHASIQVSESDLQQAYDAERGASLAGERRQGRHILLRVTDDRSEAQAIEELIALKERLQGGADFAELAREYSEDRGSAEAGGELGMVGRGIFDPEFENALWSLQEGEISEPVVTEFGVHLIRLDAVEVVEYPPFDEKRDEIERRLRRDQAEILFADRVKELDNLAFEQADHLEGIAEELGLEVKTAAGVSRTHGPGVFANAVVRDAIYSADILDKGYNTPAIELTGERAVVARVTQRHEPQPIPLEEVAEDIRDAIVAERARALAQQAHADALARVTAGENVSVVADDYELRWQRRELAERNDPEVAQAVLAAAFELPRPGPGEKSVGQAALGDGELAVVTVTRVVDGDVEILADSEIENLRNTLAGRAANLDFSAFIGTLEDEASISRP